MNREELPLKFVSLEKIDMVFKILGISDVK